MQEEQDQNAIGTSSSRRREVLQCMPSVAGGLTSRRHALQDLRNCAFSVACIFARLLHFRVPCHDFLLEVFVQLSCSRVSCLVFLPPLDDAHPRVDHGFRVPPVPRFLFWPPICFLSPTASSRIYRRSQCRNQNPKRRPRQRLDPSRDQTLTMMV